MSSKNTISGHVRNIANFDRMISICTGIGTSYQPSSEQLALTKLQLLYTAADTAKTALENVMPAYTQAVTIRETAFAPLGKLVTSIINALIASDAAPGVVQDVKSISRKFTSQRKKKKKTTTTDTTTPPPTTTPADADEHAEYTKAQLSYDSKVSNLEALIALLTATPSYIPNEDALKPTALTAMHTTLKGLNKAVVDAYQPVANARIKRNSILYAKTTGLVDTSKKVKAYVKSVKGTRSDTYKQLVALKFTVPQRMDPNLTFTLVSPA